MPEDILLLLREMASRIECIQTEPDPEENPEHFVPPIMDLPIVQCSQVYDWLEYHKSPAFADAFKRRFDKLEDLAKRIPCAYGAKPAKGRAKTGKKADAERDAEIDFLLEQTILVDYLRELADSIQAEFATLPAASPPSGTPADHNADLGKPQEARLAAEAGAASQADGKTDADKWYPAKHYDRYNISADTLRQAAHDRRIRKRKGNGNRNEYPEADVRRCWPHLFPA